MRFRRPVRTKSPDDVFHTRSDLSLSMSSARESWREHKVLLLTAVAISIALSLWRIGFSDVINNDGVMYLSAANRITQGDWHSFLDYISLPVFPGMIAGVHQLFGVSLETSAKMINTVFFAGVVVLFVLLVGELGGDRRTLAWGAAVILFFSQINDYRAFIIRDTPYWFFVLLGLLLYMKYYRTPSWPLALGWALSFVAAMMYRFEGVFYLALMPLAGLLQKQIPVKARLQATLKAYSVPIAGVLVLLLMGLGHQGGAGPFVRVGNIISGITNAIPNMVQAFSQHSKAVEPFLLHSDIDKYTGVALVAALLAAWTAKLVNTLTLPYAALAVYAWYTRMRWKRAAEWRVVVWALGIGVALSLGVLFTQFLANTRHMIPMALMILLAVPFVLSHIQQNWWERRQTRLGRDWQRLAALGAVAIVFLSGVHGFGREKTYIAEAGRWLKPKLNGESVVYSTDNKVLYYAGWFDRHAWRPAPTWAQIKQAVEEGKEADYYIIYLRRKHAKSGRESRELLGEPVKVFANRDDDKVIIFSGRRGGTG